MIVSNFNIWATTPPIPRNNIATAFAVINVSLIRSGILFPKKQPMIPATMIAITFTTVPKPCMSVNSKFICFLAPGLQETQCLNNSI